MRIIGVFQSVIGCLACKNRLKISKFKKEFTFQAIFRSKFLDSSLYPRTFLNNCARRFPRRAWKTDSLARIAWTYSYKMLKNIIIFWKWSALSNSRHLHSSFENSVGADCDISVQLKCEPFADRSYRKEVYAKRNIPFMIFFFYEFFQNPHITYSWFFKFSYLRVLLLFNLMIALIIGVY